MTDSAPLKGPWRVLVLDRTSDDPKWIIATVTIPSDVRPAQMEADGSRYTGWAEVTGWVREQVGQRVHLVPISATVWRVDEQGGMLP